MNVRKYIAPNARDALRKVKETLGPDAIILSNRSVAGGVEIMAVAARDISMLAPAGSGRDNAASADDYTVRLSPAGAQPPLSRPAAAVRSAPAVAPAAPPAVAPARPVTARSEAPSLAPPVPPKLDPRPVVAEQSAEVVPAVVMDEIRALRRIVEQHLAGFAWGESARSEPVKTEVLRQLLDAGFSPQLARDLLAGLPHDFTVAQALAWVRAAADRSLLTTDGGSDIVDRGGVYALVGPTGVGKTTTTAKLAARCVLRHGAAKVALVTTDGYRIGAHEQLRIYGRILGVPVHLVKDAADLRQTLGELQHKHMVLIDTMGMSQRDRLVSEQVAMFGESGVKRLLLLPATGRGDTLDDVVRAYNGPDMAGCIVTKVDEAASLAPSLDVIMRQRLSLHYISNGQRVPEDLHLPNRTYLLHRAFKEAPEASPHRFDGVEPRLVMANAAVAGGQRG
ncbi:flagellar biosynthesis protein FlhF [Rhodocyclus tenuis]|uniref:Flagellar biosynthesis protein FlhF n=2 Tax=Rhodocyclus TaxID=1064 RepID=A0A6L5JZG2_RHOTE|nr:flagellar biosynthesis protein FlhF [Rhodocyclus gracilis]MQY51618.1 flagellar biosynthesis protein FlhF [Rhodocyclus gracilis]MRD73099.1 flagellar biosynthesis protein FlhF [Rhodocyclus gracilis]NJA89123.1 flagellar biosynthesis protein FlhF [Rhodocyclus gracilis]